MASVTFSPQGTQLDNDEIADLQVNIGDSLEFSSILDTSGLDADLQSIKVRLQGDSTEFNQSSILTDFFETTFPDVSFIEDNSDGDFTSVVLELRGEPGATPNTTNVLVESEATVLSGLVNDGVTDIGVTVIEAIDANGNDVTNLFEPAKDAIDLQPSPQVQTVLGTEKSEPIIGTPQNDLIEGKEGNDSIGDSEGNDESFGGEGNDLFSDGAGDDIISGGAGNDLFFGLTPGSAGDDTIDLVTGNDFAFGGTGADTFVLNRDSGVTLIGDFTPGEDRFALGENLTKDNLNFARLNNDSPLNGSTLISDADTGELIAFANSASVEAVLNAEFVSVEDTFSTKNLPTTGGESNEPIQAELPSAQSGDIFGTPNADVLVGDDRTNLILAGDDNDFINAADGEDWVFGEDGQDVLNGEAGRDLLNGGADGDVINGSEGADTLLGKTGFDVLNGDVGNDVLLGGSDNDVISSGQGDDLLFGGAGNDALFGDEGHDTFVFASGEEADTIFDFEPGQDAIAKLAEGIAFTTDFSYDSLQIDYNAEGNYTNISEETGELITTLIGVEADQLTESSFTTKTLTPDETTAIASSGGLQIEGSDGNDRINGSDGNDIINSGNGDDTINSGAGDDTINGGRGLDILDGGAGTDVLALFALNRGDENIGFVGEADNFTFFVDGADEGTFLNIESVKFDNGEVVSTQDLDFTDTDASSEGLQIEGSDGDDRINGSDGNDIINSGNGDDTINSGAGDDTINGGRGLDILDGGAGTDVLALFALNRGDENIGFVGEADNFTFFVDGADEGTFLNIESVKFDNGEVVSTQDLDFTDTDASSEGLQIEGSDGNDAIVGSDGNDTLNGGKGDDTLNGGVGTDVLAFDFEPSENITYVGSADNFNVLVDSINEGTFTNIESIEFANGDVIATQDLDFA